MEFIEEIRKVLIQAKEILEIGWCSKNFAIDSNGVPVRYNDKSAVKFCITGAIKKAVGLDTEKLQNLPLLEWEARLALFNANRGVITSVHDLFVYNDKLYDTNDKEQLLALFDVTLIHLEKES